MCKIKLPGSGWGGWGGEWLHAARSFPPHLLPSFPPHVAGLPSLLPQLVNHLPAISMLSSPPAGRSELAFLYDILGEVIKAGATTLNIPDTTGWNLPHEFQVGGRVVQLRAAGGWDRWARR